MKIRVGGVASGKILDILLKICKKDLACGGEIHLNTELLVNDNSTCFQIIPESQTKMGRPKAVRTAKATESASTEKKSRGKRYSDAEKGKIIEHALAEINSGGQITKIAEKLGVTFFTLKTWLKDAGSSKDTLVAPKRGRGRPKGSVKKVAAAPAAAEAAPAPAAAPVAKVPGKRGRKPKSAVAAPAAAKSAGVPDYIQGLEQKLEELTRRYMNLAHLYGEIVSKVGSHKV